MVITLPHSHPTRPKPRNLATLPQEEPWPQATVFPSPPDRKPSPLTPTCSRRWCTFLPGLGPCSVQLPAFVPLARSPLPPPSAPAGGSHGTVFSPCQTPKHHNPAPIPTLLQTCPDCLQGSRSFSQGSRSLHRALYSQSTPGSPIYARKLPESKSHLIHPYFQHLAQSLTLARCTIISWI